MSYEIGTVYRCVYRYAYVSDGTTQITLLTPVREIAQREVDHYNRHYPGSAWLERTEVRWVKVTEEASA